MIPTFIPSKDRPAQLLLLLESLAQNSPNTFSPRIMYKASNDDYRFGYEIVKSNKAAKDCVWVEEKDGEEEFYQFLEENAAKDELVCLFADDCIFYRKNFMKVVDIRNMMNGGSIFSFSFRLGQNISIADYVTNRPCQHPEHIGLTPYYMFWDYTKINFWDMFGFTVGFDGYVYRAKDLLELSDRSGFGGRICTWEHMICRKFLDKGSIRKSMASPIRSCVFVQQINVTHEYTHRTNNTFHASKQELNKQLLNGYKIDLSSINFEGVNCTHGELSFEFAKNDG
jgi:hypothetical protein